MRNGELVVLEPAALAPLLCARGGTHKHRILPGDGLSGIDGVLVWVVARQTRIGNHRPAVRFHLRIVVDECLYRLVRELVLQDDETG